jgi:undecaprenyl pyrophosphate synthase
MYSHEGTSVEKFYNNLERFEFKEVKKKGHGAKNNTGAFVHPSFQRGDYKKIEQHCRKSFDEWMKMNESSDTE